jgi:hypothetical protein
MPSFHLFFSAPAGIMKRRLFLAKYVTNIYSLQLTLYITLQLFNLQITLFENSIFIDKK